MKVLDLIHKTEIAHDFADAKQQEADSLAAIAKQARLNALSIEGQLAGALFKVGTVYATRSDGTVVLYEATSPTLITVKTFNDASTLDVPDDSTSPVIPPTDVSPPSPVVPPPSPAPIV